MSHTREHAHVQLSLSVSSPTISVKTKSPSDHPFQLIVTARVIDSSVPKSAITLCTDGSVLDNGQHERQDGLFRGAFLALQSITDPQRTISLSFLGTPNYGSQPNANPDMRKQPWRHFDTVPAAGEGDLVIKHDVSLERLFQYSRRPKITDIQLGEKYRIKLNPKRLFVDGWWTFGALDDDEGDIGLVRKKFARWLLPDADGDIANMTPGEVRPNVEQMKREGWVFSNQYDDLEVTEAGTGEGIVIEFTE